MKLKHSRRIISSIAALSVALPSAAVLFPAQSSAAPSMAAVNWNSSQSHQIDRYKDKALEIFYSLTPGEKARLGQLREEVKAKPLAFWRDEILQNPKAVEKLKAKGVTAEEASAMLRDAVVLLYTPGDTEEALAAFKKNHYGTWKKIFGTEFKQEDLLKFASMLQKQVLAEVVMNHMLNVNKPLDSIISDSIARMMKHGQFKKLATKLAEIGITSEDVLAIRKRIVREFDPNYEVVAIFVQAFARNNTQLILQPGKFTPGKVKQLTLKVDFPGYFTIRSGIEWSSSNPDVATVDERGNLRAHKAGVTVVSAKVKGIEVGQLLVTVEADKEKPKDKDDDDDKYKPGDKDKDKNKGKAKGRDDDDDKDDDEDED